MTMHLDYPYRLDARGRTAATGDDDYLRDLIEQVLFTTPGERVNRPTFGSGILRLIFAPASPEVAATAQLLVQASLREWLGDLITVEGVAVDTDPAREGTLVVTVVYTVIRTQQRTTETFVRQV
ncbi:MAG TPA: GPW/gp25 family protein [Kofleriaceae bacterium]|nr:GPW/gp25 family protein [Kofleriaceae bacterium]